MSLTLAKLQSALAAQEDKPARGFKTTLQWSVEWGKSEPQTCKLLRNAVAKGVMTRRVYRMLTAGNRLFPVPHYGPRG